LTTALNSNILLSKGELMTQNQKYIPLKQSDLLLPGDEIAREGTDRWERCTKEADEYRILEPGEVIQERDEFQCSKGEWFPTNCKKETNTSVKQYNNLTYRRKVEAAPSVTAPTTATFERHQKVVVKDKNSRFYGKVGKVIAELPNRRKIQWDTPQETEKYRHSWFWNNELAPEGAIMTTTINPIGYNA
jgi:hypothetical protein